jgi:hypothetical protein
MNLIRRAKEAVDIPVIGSLNGVSAGGWTDYAALIEEAALMLSNLTFTTFPPTRI